MSYFSEGKLVDKVTGVAAKVTTAGQLQVFATDKVPISIAAIVDANNSTILPLLAGGIFTGVATDVLGYVELAISCYSNVASALKGLVVQFSSDGTNWYTDGEAYSTDAGRDKFFSIPTQRRYVRVIYTNGAVNQATFDLSVILRVTRAKPSAHNIIDNIVGEDDAELIKSVITGLRPDGTYGNALLDNTGRQKVVAQDYLYSVAEGTIPEHFSLYKFGVRTAVAANTPSTVWEGPTALYPYMATAQQMKLASSSASDTALGTGIRTLYIEGLDDNFLPINEIVNMNGVTQVTTVNSYRRVFRAYGATCGTALTNVGIITVFDNAGTTVQLIIPAGDGQTLMTIWTVPASQALFITQLARSTDSNKGARVEIFTRLNDGGILYPWRIRQRAYLFSGEATYRFDSPLKIEAKTDIELRVLTPTAAGITSVGATFEGWYETV